MISKGIKLSYGKNETFTDLTDLQEIPELGNIAEKIDITTLDDAVKKYEDGLQDYGDSIAFKFLYKKEQFDTLTALEGEQNWKVTLPDGTTCTFAGTATVKLDGVGVSSPLTYTLSITPASEMVWG